MNILLNYHIGRIVLGSMCVGVSVWLVWSGIRFAGFSLLVFYSSTFFLSFQLSLDFFLPIYLGAADYGCT